MKIRSLVAFAALALAALSGCSEEPDIALSPEAERGRDIARSNGCSSCHGKNGQGVTAPSWQGIYLERIPVEGGDTVLADEEYLARSITDPGADIVRGWTIKMPTNNLDDDQIAAVIAYIKELS